MEAHDWTEWCMLCDRGEESGGWAASLMMLPEEEAPKNRSRSGSRSGSRSWSGSRSGSG